MVLRTSFMMLIQWLEDIIFDEGLLTLHAVCSDFGKTLNTQSFRDLLYTNYIKCSSHTLYNG